MKIKLWLELTWIAVSELGTAARAETQVDSAAKAFKINKIDRRYLVSDSLFISVGMMPIPGTKLLVKRLVNPKIFNPPDQLSRKIRIR